MRGRFRGKQGQWWCRPSGQGSRVLRCPWHDCGDRYRAPIMILKVYNLYLWSLFGHCLPVATRATHLEFCSGRLMASHMQGMHYSNYADECDGEKGKTRRCFRA